MGDDFIGNKVYTVWRDNVMFGTVTDSKIGESKWRFVLVNWANADVYNSSMPHYEPGFDPDNDWIRIDKIHKLNKLEMIEHIKTA